MKTIKTILTGLSIAVLTGCASIAGDNTRTVCVNSYPQGANIYVDNERYGTTPANITLPTYIYGGKTVMLKKAGYQEQALRVNTQFQPIALLDILVWPTFLIDGATGSLVKISTENRNLQSNLIRS